MRKLRSVMVGVFVLVLAPLGSIHALGQQNTPTPIQLLPSDPTPTAEPTRPPIPTPFVSIDDEAGLFTHEEYRWTMKWEPSNWEPLDSTAYYVTTDLLLDRVIPPPATPNATESALPEVTPTPDPRIGDRITVQSFIFMPNDDETLDLNYCIDQYFPPEGPPRSENVIGKDSAGNLLSGQLDSGRYWFVAQYGDRAHYVECAILMGERYLVYFAGETSTDLFNEAIGEFQSVASTLEFPEITTCSSVEVGQVLITLPYTTQTYWESGGQSSTRFEQNTVVQVEGVSSRNPNMIQVKFYGEVRTGSPVFVELNDLGAMGCQR